MNKERAKFLMVLMIFIIGLIMLVYADVGPKPSVTVYVKNFDDKDYYLDLLTRNPQVSFDDFNNRSYDESYKQLGLYKYNQDGWLATHIRYHLLFGALTGEYHSRNHMMVHRFSYRGVPKHFKIIVEKSNGEMIISNAIELKQFNARVIFDMRTGKVSKVPYISYGFFYFILLIVLTIVIEIFVASYFKMRFFSLIVITNVST